MIDQKIPALFFLVRGVIPGKEGWAGIFVCHIGRMKMITLIVNNQPVEVDVASDTPLLWVLRDHLGLTGTKYSCGASQCGACTVHLNDEPIRSCVTPVTEAVGKKITTIEGASSKTAQTVLAAWEKLNVSQCGFCQPGQIMTAVALLSRNPKPSDADIDAALIGNICRCGTYSRIRTAIHAAAELLS
ncbi:Isoquinoline 1-oxidoreductase subunit alpha [Gammaproteobacteria bacterium]